VVFPEGFPLSQILPKEFIMESYWDLYVAYINKCVRDNWINDIDPHHYRMEWNHWLPKATFPDIKVGQWLTFRQHSIASALQTLALKKNCMCGWHKNYIPAELLELAWPYFCAARVKSGRKGAETVHKEKTSDGKSKHSVRTMKAYNDSLTAEQKSARGKKGGAKAMELGFGPPNLKGHKFSKETLEKRSLSRKGKNYGMVGENHGFFGKSHTEEANQANREKHLGSFWVNNGEVSKLLRKGSTMPEGFILGRLVLETSLHPFWVNQSGEIIRSKEDPGVGWVRGRKWPVERPVPEKGYWWVNSLGETCRSKGNPGENWKRGRKW